MSIPNLIGDVEFLIDDAVIDGTGFLVGPNDLLTNAHVVLNDDATPLGQTFDVRFDNGRGTTATIAGWIEGDADALGQGVVLLGADQYDIALLTLADPLGDEFGFFELSADAIDRRTDLTISGFPAVTRDGDTLFIETVADVAYDAGFQHIQFTSQTAESGSSGSPLFFEEDGVFTAVGIYASGGGPTENYAGLFNPDTLDIINGWIAGNDAGEPPATSGTPIPDRDRVESTTLSEVTLTVGRDVTSAVDFDGDEDWYAVTLEAGVAYEITLRGLPSGDGSLQDPLLAVFDATGALVAANDDEGLTLNSALTFTPSTTGTFYVSAGAFSPSQGTYTLSVSTGAALAANPTALDVAAFDASYYLGNGGNADLQAAGVATRSDGFSHWFTTGFQEARVFAPLVSENGVFDDSFYLAQDPAIQFEIDQNPAILTPLDHYLLIGSAQDAVNGSGGLQRNPNAFFDPAAYRAANPDVAAAEDFFGNAVDPFVHYLQFGEQEIIDGLRLLDGLIGWDPGFYAATNPDVAGFVDAGPGANLGLVTYFQHFVTKGAEEGRAPTPSGVSVVTLDELSMASPFDALI